MKKYMERKAMRENLKLSSSLEDYLEAIARLSLENRQACCNEIAERLKVKKPSVTSALRTLSGKGLIFYHPYMPISLTEKGRKAAESVIRRHDALKNFFIKVLGVPSIEADEAACGMEHAVGEKITGKFLEFVTAMEKGHGHVCTCGRKDCVGKAIDVVKNGSRAEGHSSPNAENSKPGKKKGRK